MVAIVENWAIIVGVVVAVMPAASDDRLGTVSVRVERIDTYRDYPNLFRATPGDVVRIRATREQIGDPGKLPSNRVTIRARRGREPGTGFAAPDWAAVEQ